MALAIYKPGQGFWTRTLTAIGAAALILGGLAWLWGELSILGSSFTLTFSPNQLATAAAQWGKNANHPIAALTALADLKALPDKTNPQQLEMVGRAGQSYTLTREQFVGLINNVPHNPEAGREAAPPTQIKPDDLQGVEVRGDGVTVTAATFAARNLPYIRTSIVVALLAGFAYLIFYLLNKPNIVEFMIATEQEMRKVNWPTRREIIGSTWIVICGTLIMAVALLVIDLGFVWIFRTMGVLQG